MNNTSTEWTEKWLASVADGSNSMSQRKLSSIESRGGGLSEVVKQARKKNVHLLLLEDEEGNPIVAASPRPFKTLC